MRKYETMTITEKQAKRYKFPAKAIGTWAVIEETEEQMILHRLTKNGRLGSDRPNNILKVKKLDITEMFKPEKSQDEKVLTAKVSDGKAVVIAKIHKENIFDKSDDPQVEKNPQETIKMDEPKPYNNWENPNIGTRKSRWIAQLLEQMKSGPLIMMWVEKLGEQKIVDMILADTDPHRKGGKLYSSIAGAMRVWNSRTVNRNL